MVHRRTSIFLACFNKSASFLRKKIFPSLPQKNPPVLHYRGASCIPPIAGYFKRFAYYGNQYYAFGIYAAGTRYWRILRPECHSRKPHHKYPTPFIPVRCRAIPSVSIHIYGKSVVGQKGELYPTLLVPRVPYETYFMNFLPPAGAFAYSPPG